MKSLKYKLLNTVRDHIIEDGGLPYIVIHYQTAETLGCKLPKQFVTNGVLTLSTSVNAILNYECDNLECSFECTFNDQPFHCVVPIAAILSIYDYKQNRTGISFDLNRDLEDDAIERNKKKKPIFSIVK